MKKNMTRLFSLLLAMMLCITCFVPTFAATTNSENTTTTICETKGHIWTLDKVVTEPTCSTTGLAIYKCQECDAELESEIAKLNVTGHTITRVGTVSEATCESDGIGKYFCAECDVLFEKVDENNKKHHNWKALEEQKQTCTTALIKKGDKQCIDCGAIANSTGTIYTEKQLASRAPKHNWGTAVTIGKQTCTTAEYIYKTCKDCRTEEVTVKEALGHTEATKAAKVATCTEVGYTEELYCSVCSTVLKAAVEVPKIEHAWGEPTIKAVATTITEAEGYCGNTVEITKICKDCSEKDVSYTKLPEHKYEVKTIAPTCSAKGYSTYVCIYCENEDTTRDRFDYVDVDSTNHNYPEVGEAIGDPATCTKAGRETVKCTDCGFETIRGVQAFGHTYKEIDDTYYTNEELEAKYGKFVVRVIGTGTCLVQTEYKLTCEKCDATKVVIINDGTGNGHTKDTENDYTAPVEPTCTEPGVTEGWTCSNKWCNDEGKAYKVVSKIIPAIHDDFDNQMILIDAVEATCTEDGMKAYYICPLGHDCEEYNEETEFAYICNKNKVSISNPASLVITATGHDLVNRGSKLATCTNYGYTFAVCDTCDAYIETDKFVGMHEHNYGEVQTVDSCETGKVVTRICLTCEYTDIKQERPAGHTVIFNGVANTLTSFCGDMNTSRVCTVCKAVVAKDNHVYGAWTLADDILTRTCASCGSEDIKAHEGHIWVEAEKTEAEVIYGCICGETKVEEIVYEELPPVTTAPDTDSTEPGTDDIQDTPSVKTDFILSDYIQVIIILILVLGLTAVAILSVTKKNRK